MTPPWNCCYAANEKIGICRIEAANSGRSISLKEIRKKSGGTRKVLLAKLVWHKYKKQIVKRSGCIRRLLFELLSHFSKFLEAIKIGFCVARKSARFAREMHESAFLSPLIFEIWYFDIVCGNILDFTLVWRRTLGVSRRQTRESTFCGRLGALSMWAVMRVTDSCEFRSYAGCAFRFAKRRLVKSRWNVPPRTGGGDDFEWRVFMRILGMSIGKSRRHIDPTRPA